MRFLNRASRAVILTFDHQLLQPTFVPLPKTRHVLRIDRIRILRMRAGGKKILRLRSGGYRILRLRSGGYRILRLRAGGSEIMRAVAGGQPYPHIRTRKSHVCPKLTVYNNV